MDTENIYTSGLRLVSEVMAKVFWVQESVILRLWSRVILPLHILLMVAKENWSSSLLPWRDDDLVHTGHIGEAAVLWAEVDTVRTSGARKDETLQK